MGDTYALQYYDKDVTHIGKGVVMKGKRKFVVLLLVAGVLLAPLASQTAFGATRIVKFMIPTCE